MEESSSEKGNKVSVPIAIIVAGALIAGAIYLSNTTAGGTASSATKTTTNTQPIETMSDELAIKPVSAEDHIIGNPNASVAMVVFTDTECPFCKSFHQTMQKVMDTYGKDGKVAWVYRDFPIEQLHSKASKEAEATECAADLGGQNAYWAFINGIFSITPSNDGLDPAKLPEIAKNAGINVTKFNECLSSGTYTAKVQAEYEEAVSAGGRGTPYIVYVSKTPISIDTKQLIQSLGANMPPDTFVISKDNYRVSMSGALPYQTVSQILTSLLK